MRGERVGGRESWYTLLPFCEITDIQSFSSQLYETIIDYLLKLAKVTSKQCPGTIWMRKWF